MVDILTIPKKLIQKGELVIMARAEYEEVLKLRKRLIGEEKDTDEAIRVFERERRAGKLKKATHFSEILGARKARS